MKFAEGNAIKYICRHINKGGEQDLQKAKHYIDMIIERDYGDDAEKSKVFAGVPIKDPVDSETTSCYVNRKFNKKAKSIVPMAGTIREQHETDKSIL